MCRIGLHVRSHVIGLFRAWKRSASFQKYEKIIWWRPINKKIAVMASTATNVWNCKYVPYIWLASYRYLFVLTVWCEREATTLVHTIRGENQAGSRNFMVLVDLSSCRQKTEETMCSVYLCVHESLVCSVEWGMHESDQTSMTSRDQQNMVLNLPIILFSLPIIPWIHLQ